ncbi:hypothetical protein BBK82_04970 [Lentzea guizhouensis]|uniref:Phage tail protein n=2 Tax=Lentzea guizhouensis TaxID=1586287 RepID=A0A1B2HCT5_9PSEU|nr:hypothetical protein BBK82_04970 [Lentzea guizhouensis]
MAAGDLITVTDPTQTQVEWRGLLLGHGTRYRMTGLEGWVDSDDIRDGDVELDNEHGAHPGQLLLARKVVTFEGHIAGPSGFTDAVNELRRVTTQSENPDEEPLVVHTAGIKAMVNARCVGRIIPQHLEWISGFTRIVLRWRATNPRMLRLPQLAPVASPPVSGGGGLIFPLVFPLRFGGAPSGGELVLANDGHAHAQPVWRITGPCVGPMITNADTGARLWFEPDFALNSGERLDLSTEDKSVLYADTSPPVSRSNQLAVREWFTLPPGTSTRVRFDTVDGNGTLTCLYHHTDL